MKKDNERELLIPLYINEKIVFDMLAIIDDGFTSVEQVEKEEKLESSKNKKVNGEVSTGSILSNFFNINIEGDFQSKDDSQNTLKSSTTKAHTSTSLLSKLKLNLQERGLLKSTTDNIDNIKPGDFIEFTGKIKKTSLKDYLEEINQLFSMFELFSKISKESNKAGPKQTKDIKEQLNTFMQIFKNDKVTDFVISNNKLNVIFPLDNQYLFNNYFGNYEEGTFKVLGKVISVYSNEEKDISLISNSAISLLPQSKLDEIPEIFNKTAEIEKFQVTKIKIKIDGPAIKIVPIALYE